MKDIQLLVDQFKALSRQRKIELYCVTFICIVVLVAGVYTIQAFKSSRVDLSGVKELREQNLQLEKNNQILLHNVSALNNTIRDRAGRDSLLGVLIEKQSGLLPGIDIKLQKIEQKYENLSSYQRLDAADIQRYITGEAERLRRVQ